MRKLVVSILILVCILPMAGYTQVNYVRNGSFEKYDTCPTGYDQIRRANFWQGVDSTILYEGCLSEYCNACSSISGFSFVGVPLGYSYHHYPRTGDGMVQVKMYYDDVVLPMSYVRDYPQGKLYAHLTAGVNYCVTFYITLAQGSQYAINKQGAYLDDGSIDAAGPSCGLVITSVTPQVFSSLIIDDTLNWVKVQGSYTAIGTERYITMGNFFDAANTDTIGLHPHTTTVESYYLIDDVSVIASDVGADAGGSGLVGLGDTVHIGTYEEGMPCTWYVQGGTTPIGYGGGIWVHPTVTTSYVVALDLCNGITYDTMTLYVCPAGVSALSYPGDLMQLYPNPTTNEVHIDHVANCLITVYDITGKTMLTHTPTNDKATINIETLPTGMYMVQITDPKTGNKVVRRLSKS